MGLAHCVQMHKVIFSILGKKDSQTKGWHLHHPLTLAAAVVRLLKANPDTMSCSERGGLLGFPTHL